MRFIFFILLIQFTTSAYAQVNVDEYSVQANAAYNRHETGICQDIFFKESCEEKNEHHKVILTAELIDFSFLATVLTQQHSRFACAIDKHPHVQQQRFKLNCSFLI